MEALLTSDWQVQWANLDKCEKVLEHMLAICKARKITHVIHCGDLKQYYNPLDGRVINFAVHFATRLRQAGVTLLIDLGNHDRLSMTEGSDDWFPALEAAGAIVFSQPKVYKVNGYRLFMVPYFSDLKKLSKYLAKQAAFANPRDSIMIFHNEIVGCHANVISKMNDGISVKRLMPRKYKFCLGGHIHLHQQIDDNVWYVGSPFAQDWGEANQRKGFVIANFRTGAIEFIPSTMPRFYDPTWPRFPKSKTDWRNTSVRIHVPVPANVHNVAGWLSQQKAKAEAKYPGATIVTVPEYANVDAPIKIKYDGSDEDKVSAYVEQTCPATLSKSQATSMLSYYLRQVGGFQAAGAKVTLLDAVGKNFLCFKEVKADYRQPGITVVTGKNVDWSGRNNGSGKTSYLQLPIVAWFGQTLKGQQNDKWVRRQARKQRAYVRFRFRLADGRLCKIYRGRHPVKLQFTVAGKDASTGIGVKGTQSAIESATGLSWEKVVNAMYIDQSKVSDLLTGTDATRKAIFAEFLNLERFQRARALLLKRHSKVEDIRDHCEGQVTSLRDSLGYVRQMLADLPSPVELRKAVAKSARLKQLATDALEEYKTKRGTRLAAYEEQNTKVKQLRAKHMRTTFELEEQQSKLDKLSKVKPVCPICHRPIDINPVVRMRKALKASIAVAESTETKLAVKVKQAVVVLERYIQQKSKEEAKLRKFYASWSVLRERYIASKQTVEQITEALGKRKKLLQERTSLKRSIHAATVYLVQLDEELAFLKYTLACFSNNGLPMYIAGQLCPQLNKSAKYYADIFSEGAIRVQFTLTDQSVDVDVINIYGGELVKDQSQGELRIAALIVGFALRDVMNPCNVMILDEPGESLDAYNAKVFAEGLKTIAKDSGPILVTTHNPHILAELESVRIIEVTKKNRVSRALPQQRAA